MMDPELLEILACPACKTAVRQADEHIVCDACGRRFPIENDIPVMLLDRAVQEKPTDQ